MSSEISKRLVYTIKVVFDATPDVAAEALRTLDELREYCAAEVVDVELIDGAEREGGQS